MAGPLSETLTRLWSGAKTQLDRDLCPPGSVVRIPYGDRQLLDMESLAPHSLLARGSLHLFARGLPNMVA